MDTQAVDCSSIKQSLISYFQREIEIDLIRDRCMITLPIRTVDERFVTIYVEKRLEDFYTVHDGGKTVAELYSYGIHLTDIKAKVFIGIANNLGVSFGNRMFQYGCKLDSLQKAILAIAECQVLATLDVLNHRAIPDELSVQSLVKQSLDEWKPDFVRAVDVGVGVMGKLEEHKFDFVTYADDPHKTVALKVISPSSSAIGQAERYGFLVLDLDETPFAEWSRLAIVTKSDIWTTSALELVRGLSSESIMLLADQEAEIGLILPDIMNKLVA